MFQIIPNVYTALREKSNRVEGHEFLQEIHKEGIEKGYLERDLKYEEDILRGELFPKRVHQEQKELAYKLGLKTIYPYMVETSRKNNEKKGTLHFATSQGGVADILKGKKNPIWELPGKLFNTDKPITTNQPNIGKLVGPKMGSHIRFDIEEEDPLTIDIFYNENAKKEGLKMKRSLIFGDLNK